MRKKYFYMIFILLLLSVLSKRCCSTPNSEPIKENSKIVTAKTNDTVPITNPCPKLGTLEREKFEKSI